MTLNLVDIALSANKDMEKFWAIFDERLELVKEALKLRNSLLKDSSTNVSPIHWQYGGLARLGEEETFNKLMKGGYSSISLGYIGIYEMCMAMLGKSNTTEEGAAFAKQVMEYLEATAKKWKETEEGLDGCAVYGTPSESLCYKFALKTQKRFGVIKDITDKDWFTNSYHVCVYEPINAFDKLTFESTYQKLSKGGAVSYVEVPDLSNNLEALNQVVNHIYNTMVYAEINVRNADTCACGFEGELKIDENGEWYCPKCGNRDTSKMYICRRVCGYLAGSNQGFNHGKTMEMKNRVQHL